MSIVYNVAFIVLLPFLLARLWWRSLHEPSFKRRWPERFARKLPDALPRNAIWIHAVSVGETVATTPIIACLAKRYPSLPVVVTTTTFTGAATVASRFDATVPHVFFPYDLPWVITRFLARLQPRMLILMETELWPNLLAQCAKNEIPVLVANARISVKSARRYALVPRVTKAMFAAIDCFAVQGQNDMNRFIELGASAQRVVVTGSLKFDVDLPPSTSESGQALRRCLGVSRPVWMAGSTRDGEEELVLQALTVLKEQNPDLLLVLAPRHPQRFDGVAELVAKRGFVCVRHSHKVVCSAAVDVYLLDSMGELPNFYAASDIAFVGGSLVSQGGHNVLEPAALGVPVVVGPYTYNFTDIVAMLRGVGALVAVENVEELAREVGVWVRNVEKRDAAGAAGRLIVQQNRGSVGKVVTVIEDVLEGRRHSIRPDPGTSRLSG